MERETTGFASELRISAKPVAALLVVLGQALVFASSAQPDTFDQLKIVLFGVLVHVSSALVWWLDDLKPWVGRWLLVLVLVVSVHLGNGWLGVPQILTLLVIPTGLAAALISLPAATIIATSETLLLALLPQQAAVGADLATIAIALVVVWATLGVLYAVYQPVYQLNRWLSEYFERGWRLLEEARDRKAEVEQALEDLSHANRQLALANKRTATLRQIAEKARKSKATFVAKVSHEFRTPLNIIIGMISLMIEAPEVYEGDFPPRALEHMRTVYRNCQHLSGMIEDVLDLSQAEAGQMKIHREQVDLAEVINTALKVVCPLLDEKGLAWEIAIPHDLPSIFCDRVRIRQVILNLLSNAARFTKEGGITVKVDRQDLRIVISVADTGPGISPEDAERIFEPFFRGTSELWRNREGSGLGLSISKQFVELHGGRMWLESELGVGTTFFVELQASEPLAHSSRPGHQIREEWIWIERKSKPDLPDSHYKPRVVICDETGDLYPALAHQSDEIEFADTRNLSQAIEELAHCPARTLLLNSASPHSLWSLVERARQTVPDTPIIGCSYPPKLEHALKAGAVDYITTPLTRSGLINAIERIGTPVRRVLVVDDHADTRALLRLFVHVWNSEAEVVVAESGEQALKELHSRPPDLVLLDIVMPDMDGWEVLATKSEDEALKDIPTIMISAQDSREGPMMSKVVLATMGEGMSVSKLLDCSTALSAILLQLN